MKYTFKFCQGLCGTFNKNQQDDLLTPENDIEKSITAFANKWRSNEKCEAEREPYDGSNACEIYVQNKVAAEEYCKNLTGPIFQGKSYKFWWEGGAYGDARMPN